MPVWIRFRNGGGFRFDVDEEEKSIKFTNLDHDALLKEIEDRKKADGALQANISAEATARENADTALQANIDAEAGTREAADGTLQSNIAAEAGAREDADSALQANIDAEAAARKAKDVASVAVGDDGVTVTLTRSDATELALSLLLVTGARDGLMTKEAYNLLTQLDSRVLNLEHAGVWRGSFDAYADLPADTGSDEWTSGVPLAGDFVDVRDDETHGGGVTRYIVTAVSESGEITYGFDIQLDADIPTATTGGLGLVMGAADLGGGLTDANYGKIFAEAGGILSMIGADALRTLLNTVNTNFTAHAANGDIHITAGERAKWNNNDTSELFETVKIDGEAI
jgi:hypothetical protein